MNPSERFASIVARLQESTTVESVYGDPIESNGRTVVPVAKVRYGFGGGYGSDPDDAGRSPDAEESTGAGMGGGVVATPTGVVEISDSGTRFVRFGDGAKRAAAVAVALGIGYLLGRMRSSRD